MADFDFDPNSLTWKVFCNVVREKHGHELIVRRDNAHEFWWGECRYCGLNFDAEVTLKEGWLSRPWRRPDVARECMGTRLWT